jgi:hypothetical protein
MMICLSSRGYINILTGNILYLIILDIVKNYLIKLWINSTSDFVNQITWSTNKKAEDFIIEVSESLPKGIRATIEEKNERAIEKTR